MESILKTQLSLAGCCSIMLSCHIRKVNVPERYGFCNHVMNGHSEFEGIMSSIAG